MATLNGGVATLNDWAKTRDPDGTTADVVDLLSQENAILEDQQFIEGNLPAGHQSTIQTSEPSATFRKLNEGVAPTKGTTAQITDQASILESWSEVDVKLAALNGDVSRFRLQQAKPHIRQMAKTQASTLLYGNAGTSPNEYDGLSVRYNSLTGNNSVNVLDGGGSGSDNLSIWLVCWGEDMVHGIFPKGGVGGLERNDFGIQTIQTNTGIGTGRMRAYQEQYVMTCGLAVPDWRTVVRISNVDASDLSGVTSAADISELMARALERPPTLTAGKPCFYMNRTARQMLNILNRNDVISGGGLTFDNVDGKRYASYQGIPVKTVDQLTVTEAEVT
tara:strand:+ start:81 stop:1082 length:1002 start_codon:yes stop_codon:yes gene_type:complete